MNPMTLNVQRDLLMVKHNTNNYIMIEDIEYIKAVKVIDEYQKQVHDKRIGCILTHEDVHKLKKLLTPIGLLISDVQQHPTNGIQENKSDNAENGLILIHALLNARTSEQFDKEHKE